MDIKVEQLNEEQLAQKSVEAWPIWTKEVSRFAWTYDEQEQCYLLEGEVIVETDEDSVQFGKGDFVTFPAGLSCVWDVKSPVKKHYRFG